jgi:hypothetical protein
VDASLRPTYLEVSTNGCSLLAASGELGDDGGVLHAPGMPAPPTTEILTEMACECAKEKPYTGVAKIPVDDWLKCCILGQRREKCVKEKVEAQQKEGKLKDVHMPAGANYDSDALPEGQKYCRPDIVLGPGPKPLQAGNMTGIVDLKFPCNKDGELQPEKIWSPTKAMSKAQRDCYSKIKMPGGEANLKDVKVTACGPTKEACGG